MGGESLDRGNQKFRFEHISADVLVSYPSEGTKSAARYLCWSPVKGLGRRDNFMSHWHLGKGLQV